MTSKDITITYGEEVGDCTRPYHVTLNRSDITVKEFIDYVLSERKSEWGYIRIYNWGNKAPWDADYKFEYKHGEAKVDEVVPSRILASCIKQLVGSGGWSRSDWDIIIEGKEQMNKEDAIKKLEIEKKFGSIKKFENGSGYSSPIQLILSDIQMKLEDNVCEAVQNVGVKVDKDELIKALQYDREQYDKGFVDGYAQGVEMGKSIVIENLKRSIERDFDRKIDVKFMAGEEGDPKCGE